MPTTRARLRLAIVSPHPAAAAPTAAYTDELVRGLAKVAPEIATWICAINRHDEPRSGRQVMVSIVVDDPTDYRRAAHRLRALGTDVVLVQYRPDPTAGPHARYLLVLCDELARLAVPYLVLLHDVRRCPLPADADIMAALCRRAAGVAVVSDAAAAVLVHRRIAAADTVAVVPPGAPPELSAGTVPEPTDARLRSALATGTLLSTVGPVRPAKGLHVAIAALAGITRRHPDVRYLVAERFPDPARRSADPYRQALRTGATALGLDSNVHLIEGLTPADQVALLRSTALYLAPDLDRDRTSSTGLTYALAAGCPVVASDTPATRPLVTTGTGALVRPGDPAALATAVNRLLRDPARLAEARTAATRRGADLSFAATAEQLAGLAHLVARRGTRAPARVA